MKSTVSEPQSWKKVIAVEVAADEFSAELAKKMKKVQKEVRLPGFRQGKVPESVIKQRFGESIKAEVIEHLIQESYKSALDEHKISPVASPKVTDLKNEENSSLTFTIETEIDPEISITGYQNLKVKVAAKKIKDSDVEDAFNNLLERFSTFKDIDRAIKKGDFIKLEYLTVSIDGEVRSDFKNPTYPVEVGGENSLKEFHKGVIGHSAGETVDISIKFPKDYSEASVAGKPGEFQIKITSVQEKILPEINEEFLKKLGNFADEAALREHIRKDLEAEEQKRAKEEAQNSAIETLIDKNEFDVPPARIEQFIDYAMQETTKHNQKDGPVPNREEFAKHYHDIAIKTLKRHRIIDDIAKKEQIKPTQEEVDEEIKRIAEMYQQDFETLKQALRKNGTTMRIREEIRDRKTLSYLIGEYTPEKSTE